MTLKCEECNKEFSSKEALNMHNQAKHMSKEDVEEKRKFKKRSKKHKKVIIWSVVVIIVVVLGYLLISNSYQESYTKEQVHWHATVNVFTCGEKRELPIPLQGHLGGPLLHTHDDGRIHIEGKIWKGEDITLGKYFKVIGLKFTNEQIMNFKNGDLCDGKSGKVKLFVNDEENSELSDYVIKDDEGYEIRFE